MAQILRQCLIIVAVLGICYAYVLPRWSDWNQNSRLNLLLALADDGTVQIDKYVANTGDYAIYEGRAYTDKAPGPVFLALPGYLALRPLIDHPVVASRAAALGGSGAMAETLNEEGTGIQAFKVRFALVQYLMTALTIALPAAVLGALFYIALLGAGIAARPAALATLGYGLGTTAAPYAGNFYSHQLTAALLFGAFLVAWRPWERADPSASPRRAGVAAGLLCGLLLGWSVISEYPTVLPAAAIGVYALYRQGWRWLPALLVGGALPGALLITYDLIAFGTPWPIGYAYSALWQDQHQTGFMSLTYPRFEALWGLTFSFFRGLFIRAPWLLLAIPGLVFWWRSGRLRAEWWTVLGVVLTTYTFYSSSIMWWGGFTAGPRYIVPLIPFLALGAAWLIGSLHGARLALAAALVTLSIGLTWLEAVAGQLFPPDTIRATWTGYVFPAWAAGDIARNLGNALGLPGAASLLPLLIVTAAGAWLLLRKPLQPARSRTLVPATTPERNVTGD
jgi:hypothetical protein